MLHTSLALRRGVTPSKSKIQRQVHPKHRIRNWFGNPAGATVFKSHMVLPYERVGGSAKNRAGEIKEERRGSQFGEGEVDMIRAGGRYDANGDTISNAEIIYSSSKTNEVIGKNDSRVFGGDGGRSGKSFLDSRKIVGDGSNITAGTAADGEAIEAGTPVEVGTPVLLGENASSAAESSSGNESVMMTPNGVTRDSLFHFPDVSKTTQTEIDWMWNEPKSGYEFRDILGEHTVELTNIPMGITPEKMQERFRR
jgi:hypothetical protein